MDAEILKKASHYLRKKAQEEGVTRRDLKTEIAENPKQVRSWVKEEL